MKNIKLELDSVLMSKIHSQLWSISNSYLNNMLSDELFHPLWSQLDFNFDSPIQEQLENNI
jgi:hypothetical protein